MMANRLDKLRSLKDGWLDGRGKAPDAKGLDWLANEFENQYPDELPLPYLYPTAEGGVQAEWTLSKTEISLDINLVEHKAAWHSVNMETLEEISEELDLTKSTGWIRIAENIRSLVGGEA